MTTHVTRPTHRARRFHRGDDRRLHRTHVGHQVGAGVERLDHHFGDVPDRHRHHGEICVGHRRREVGCEQVDRWLGVERSGRVGVAVEAAHGHTRAPERKANRPADQAGADERAETDWGSATTPSVGVGPARSARNSGGALEEHVVQLVARPLRVAVHEDPDAQARPVRNVLLLGAEQRDLVEPECRAGRARRGTPR